jgi:hypothetical protein
MYDITYVQHMDYIVSFFSHLDNRRSAYIFLFVPQLHNTVVPKYNSANWHSNLSDKNIVYSHAIHQQQISGSISSLW